MKMLGPALLAIALLAPSTTLAQLLPPAERADAGKEERIFEDVVAWVNDDVILWTDLVDAEKQSLAERLQGAGSDPERLSQLASEVRQETLLQMIWNRLLVQEAERLYDIKSIRKDLVQSFMERQQLKSEQELDEVLRQYGLSREDLEDRLLVSRMPDYVVDAQVMQQMGIGEAEARAWYDAHLDRFRTAAEVSFREIVIDAPNAARRAERRADAEKVVLLARSGQDFEKLVAEFSEAPSKAIGGRIGPLDPRDLRPEIATQTLAVSVGGVSDPIETPSGWHVIKVETRKDVRTPPFEEVKDDVENEIRRERFGPAYEQFVAKLWDGSVIEVRDTYADRVPSPWREKLAVRK
ncbi:MAG: hypothetical protein HC882_08655 [Acidobacteria bacterium]|nr:hypothetical protein [Acidobacteriota bacterium]